MINDKQLEQTNEAGSTGYQSGGAMVIHGVSYSEARQIALDLWKANALELSHQAAQDALEKATKLWEAFFDRIGEKNPSLFGELKIPGMQWALFNAQRDYARSGDQDVLELLVELLSERIEKPDRDVLQIVLDESLSTVVKLTEEHLDVLTILFIFNKLEAEIESSFEGLDNFLRTYVKPFCTSARPASSCISHLQYSGCLTVSNEPSRQSRNIEQVTGFIRKNYPVFFMRGFDQHNFESECGFMSDYPGDLFIPYLYNKELIQFNYTSLEDFFEVVRQIEPVNQSGIISPDDKSQILLRYVDKKKMTSEEAEHLLISRWPFMQNFINYSSNYKFSYLSLTSVGLVLANANFKRKTGIELSMSLWIN